MEPWEADIGYAYLEALTSEKVCIRAGPEFRDLEGHLLIIYKTLYDSQLSGKAFGQMLQEYLLDLGFVPSFAESLIYMKNCPTANHYQYIATQVDNLAIIMKNPQVFIDQLELAPYNFKLKGSGPLNFHLGCGFHEDITGTLCMDPGKYIDQMEEIYVELFRVKPGKKYRSPLQKGDHPKLDTTPFLDEEGKEIYQSLIGSVQLNVAIGRFDSQSAIILMSRYPTAPREGYLERVCRIYGYLCRFR